MIGQLVQYFERRPKFNGHSYDGGSLHEGYVKDSILVAEELKHHAHMEGYGTNPHATQIVAITKYVIQPIGDTEKRIDFIYPDQIFAIGPKPAY